MHELGYKEYIPFLSIIGNSNEIFCFDKNENIVLMDYYETGEITTIEVSFSECLIKQIKELKGLKNRKISGEDKQL